MKALALALATLALAACGTEKQDNSETNGFPGFQPKYTEANMFACEVAGGLQVIYSSTSMIGQPELSVQATEEAASLDNVSVVGDQIEFGAGEEGATLVTAHRYIPDFKSTTWTLAVPQVLLGKDETSRSIETTLTKVEARTSIIGPRPGDEPVTTIMKAKCEASSAKF